MNVNSLFKNTVLAVICLVLVIPNLIYIFPSLVGADRSYTVMSGSMNPALIPGDLVIVKERESSEISVGDMVTIRNEDFIFTHRVIERLEGGLFRLKGDANEGPDMDLVDAAQIIGVVVQVFPFGYLYNSIGFALALLVPAALIMGKQIHTIYQHTKRRNKRETMRWRRKSKSPLDTSTLLLALILTVSTTRVIAPNFIAGSSSYFSDTEWSTGSFRAGIWHVDALVDIKPESLNLDSKGKWVKVNATIETEYEAYEIDIGTVKLEEILADGGEVIAGYLIVKFDRNALINYLIDENVVDGETVPLTVSGSFNDGVSFSGVDTIVIRRSDG